MATKKPGDETLPGGQTLPFGTQAGRDTFSTSVSSGSHKAVGAEAAPEASQGRWRERAFTPRGVMPPEEVLKGLEAALRVSLASVSHPKVAFDEVRTAWLPFLRQAMEQAGGDGLDAWLQSMLHPPARSPADRLLLDLTAAVGRMRAAVNLVAFEEEALQAIGVVRAGLHAAAPRKLSFKQLEKELEGKLEVDELMLVLFSDPAELGRRVQEIASSLDSLRAQIRRMPGKQPDGMYSNFARLKAAFRVIDAELKRRGAG